MRSPSTARAAALAGLTLVAVYAVPLLHPGGLGSGTAPHPGASLLERILPGVSPRWTMVRLAALISAATVFAIVATTGNIYSGLWYPIIVAAASLVIGFLFLPETKDVDVTKT